MTIAFCSGFFNIHRSGVLPTALRGCYTVGVILVALVQIRFVGVDEDQTTERLEKERLL